MINVATKLFWQKDMPVIKAYVTHGACEHKSFIHLQYFKCINMCIDVFIFKHSLIFIIFAQFTMQNLRLNE